MLDDLYRIGPVLVMAVFAALIIVWDFLPSAKPFPAARGRALLIMALLAPVLAAVWGIVLRLDDETGWSFANSVYLDDLSYFFVFLFVGVAAAIVLASQDYAKSFGNYEAEYYALIPDINCRPPLCDVNRPYDEAECRAYWKHRLDGLRREMEALIAAGQVHFDGERASLNIGLRHDCRNNPGKRFAAKGRNLDAHG